MSNRIKPTYWKRLNKGHPLAKGLIGYWLMNEGCGATVNDLSEYGQTGTFGANDPSWTNGQWGSALNFATNDNIVIEPKKNPTTALTIVIWFKTSISAFQTILSWKNTGSLTYGIWYSIDPVEGADSRAILYLRNVGNNVLTLTGSGNLNDNQWHQHAITYDGSYIRAYLDGKQMNSVADNGTITYTGTNSYIGISASGTYPLTGELDNIMLYDRALTDTEISLLYYKPFCMLERRISPALLSYVPQQTSYTPVKPKPARGIQLQKSHSLSRGLVGCWLMNEGTGDKVFDLSGNLSPGTIVSTQGWKGGPNGSSVYFDGNDDYINIGQPDVSEDFSVVVRERSAGDGGYNGNDGYFIGDSTDATNFFFRRAQYTSNALAFGIGDQTSGTNVPSLVSMWHCYVLTHGNSGDEVYLYMDGELVRSYTSFSSNFNGFTGDVWIGNRATLDRDFHGNISMCLIYNRVLSALEASLLYREPFCMFDEGITPANLFVETAGANYGAAMYYHLQQLGVY